MGRIVMGYWDCAYCSTKGLMGSEQECPHCGHPRDKDVKFYVTKDTAKVVDTQTAEKVRARGKDWKCSSCDCLNPGNIDTCSYCGASRESSNTFNDTNNFFNSVNASVSRTTSDVHKDLKSESSEIHNRFNSQHDDFIGKLTTDKFVTNSDKSNNSNNKETRANDGVKVFFTSIAYKIRDNWKKIGIAAIAIALCALAAFLLIPYDKQVEITNVSWSRSISIEEYRTVQESDWTVPPNGRVQYTRQEIHHYDRVIDHYEQKSRQVIDYYDDIVTGYRDLGNGYFEEITTKKPVYKTEYYDEPVYRNDPQYATKYYYEIERWVYSRSVNTNGNDKSPYWGEVYLHNKEREGSRTSKYYVNTTDREYKVSENDWYSLNIGDNVILSVNRLGYAKIKSFTIVSDDK